MDKYFQIFSIGRIVKDENGYRLEVDVQYQDAFLGLEQFSHIDVFYWLHENDHTEGRNTLRVYPRGDRANPLTGVFATRSPRRPNPIAVTRCRITAVSRTTIEIDTIDARDGSPLIDIKAHIPSRDETEDIRVPDWVEKNQRVKGSRGQGGK